MQPHFSYDYSRLCYVASQHQFVSHSSNYQLKYINWPRDMPNDESNKAEYRNESDELQENQRNSLKAEANLSITVLDYQ